MSSFLADDSSGHKKAKAVSQNLIEKITHREYKDALLNNKCLRHSINRIRSKNQGIGTYEIKKLSLPCFEDEIYILNNGYDGLALGYQS